MKIFKFGMLVLFISSLYSIQSCKKKEDVDPPVDNSIFFLSTFHEIGTTAVPKYISRFTLKDSTFKITTETDKIVGDTYGVDFYMDNNKGNVAYFADETVSSDNKFHFIYYNMDELNFTTLPEADPPSGYTAEAKKMCPRVSDNGKIFYMQEFDSVSGGKYLGNIQIYDITTGIATSLPSLEEFIMGQPELDNDFDVKHATIDPNTQIEISQDGKFVYMNSIAFHMLGTVLKTDKHFLVRYDLSTNTYAKVDAANTIIFQGISGDDQYLFYRQNINWKRATVNATDFTLTLLENTDFDYDDFPRQRQARFGSKVVYRLSDGLHIKDMVAETDIEIFHEFSLKNVNFAKDGNSIYYVKNDGASRHLIQTKGLTVNVAVDTLASFSADYKMDMLYMEK